MLTQGTVSEADLDLLHVTDDVAEAVALIQAADAARAQHADEPEPADAVPDPLTVDD
jgi:predicted Rossmann-fold nucleotide-binding protein